MRLTPSDMWKQSDPRYFRPADEMPANKRDVPCQSLMKVLFAQALEREKRRRAA